MTETDWPHLLADLTAKRDALNTVIATITTHFVHNGEAPVEEASARKTRRRGRKPGRPKTAAKRDGRTDGRTEQEPRPRSAEPP